MHRCFWLTPPLFAFASLVATACATDESPPPPPMSAQPVPVSPSSGPPARPASALTDGGEGDASAPDGEAPRAFIYNRVLAKLEDPGAFDRAALERTLEARTGATVKEIRKGPMGLLAIVFEETSPPRGAAEQRALVEKLEGTPGLRYVEPERLLQAK